MFSTRAPTELWKLAHTRQLLASKEGSVPNTLSKKPEHAPLVSAGPSSHGRTTSARTSVITRKPGRSDDAPLARYFHPMRTWTVAAGPLTTTHKFQYIERTLSVSSETTERLIDNARKQRIIPRILAPKEL